MVVILASKDIDMQRHRGCLAEALEAVGNHLCGQRTDPGISEAKRTDKERSGRYVDDRPGERFIQRSMGITKATDAFAVSKSLRKGFSKTKKCVFGCVVVINCSEDRQLDPRFYFQRS
jgi:hypothetical protein